jgi:hypothetical protein
MPYMVHIQNVDLQNVESQNVESQNIESQNVDKTKCLYDKTSTLQNVDEFFVEQNKIFSKNYLVPYLFSHQ